MVIRKSHERKTAEALIEAATAEFAEHGFSGTDSNKIARAAGFAPQTFYRWFSDKTEIFIAVYRAWEEEEHRQLSELLGRGASARTLAQAIVTHHRTHLVFRRSLRLLAVQDEAVRRARAESRLRQIERVRAYAAEPKPRANQVAVVLLQIERLADAIAEGELRDMELSEAAAQRQLARLIEGLGSRRRLADE